MPHIPSIKRCLALALCLGLVLLLLPGRAAAAHPSLTLSFQPGGSPGANVTFRAYKVADWDGRGGFTWDARLQEKSIDLDNFDTLANTIAPYVRAWDPTATEKTGGDGTVTFSGLGTGAFLILGDRYGRYTPQPVLISLPYKGENEVKANVKYDYESGGGGSSGRDITVKKVWADTGHTDQRPKEVVVQLLKNGAVHATVTLNADNNWKHTWSGLSKNATWEVTEVSVPDGYTVSVDKNGWTFTVVNTYSPPPPPEEPDQPDNPDQPDTPDNPDEPDKPDQPVNPDQPGTPTNPSSPTTPGQTTPGKPTLPQTGQLWWPVPALAAAGMGCFLVGWLKARRDHEG